MKQSVVGERSSRECECGVKGKKKKKKKKRYYFSQPFYDAEWWTRVEYFQPTAFASTAKSRVGRGSGTISVPQRFQGALWYENSTVNPAMGNFKPRSCAVCKRRLAGSWPTSYKPGTKQHGNIDGRDGSKWTILPKCKKSIWYFEIVRPSARLRSQTLFIELWNSLNDSNLRRAISFPFIIATFWSNTQGLAVDIFMTAAILF